MSDGPEATIGKKKKGGRKKSVRKAEYGTYLHALMKQCDGNMTIKADAMLVLDKFVGDFIERLIDNGIKWCTYEDKTTFKAKHAQAALQTMCTGKLLELAVSEANKAMTKYQENT